MDNANAQPAVVLVERAEPAVGLLVLNRPTARNALSVAVISELHRGLTSLAEDARIAAIIVAANGPVFSSGHDLKELNAHRGDGDGGRAFFEETMSACSWLMQAIVNCRVPVIAAVEGTATAAGCQLVASCDLAVAAETATFATPGVNIGLFCSTPMVALSRNVPRKRAMEMLLTGEAIDAQMAAQFGLVNRVVAPGQVLEAAKELARLIAKKSRATVAVGKEAFYRQSEMGLEQAYRYASEVMVHNMMAGDACEGIAAFLDKRPAKWADA